MSDNFKQATSSRIIELSAGLSSSNICQVLVGVGRVGWSWSWSVAQVQFAPTLIIQIQLDQEFVHTYYNAARARNSYWSNCLWINFIQLTRQPVIIVFGQFQPEMVTVIGIQSKKDKNDLGQWLELWVLWFFPSILLFFSVLFSLWKYCVSPLSILFSELSSRWLRCSVAALDHYLWCV